MDAPFLFKTGDKSTIFRPCFRLIHPSGKTSKNYEWPPATIRNILIFSTSHRQACQGQNLRQNKVVFVGIGG